MINRFTILIPMIIIISGSTIFSQSLMNQDLGRTKSERMALDSYAISKPVVEKKSAAMAILLSSLLPGMGELYAGNYNSGKYFTAVDVSLWITYFGMSTYSTWKENNYKQYAKSNGGVQGDSFDSDFYANVGNYMSIEEYNNAMAFNRDYNSIYTDVNSRNWKWNSVAERKTFRGMWVSSKQASNNMRFATGALILNRIISVINAVRLVTAHNKSLSETQTVSMEFRVDPIGASESELVFNCRVNF